MIPKRQKMLLGNLGWRVSSDLVAGVGRLFSPLQQVWRVVFHVVAVRAPITTLARAKSV